MIKAAFQTTGAEVVAPPVNRWVTAPELLRTVWPEEGCRPSLRWFRNQHHLGAVPSVRAGRRVLYCPTHVLSSAKRQFTVEAKVSKTDVKGCRPFENENDTLMDALGLIVFLRAECGLRRSLRWVRQQQKDRALPYLRWGRKVFFSATQTASTLGIR
jgi:hypothetical protein